MLTLTEKFLSICQQFSLKESMRIKDADGWHIYTYQDILNGSLKISTWLKSQRFKPQDKAAIIFENSPQWPMTYFGILLADGVAVPLDPQLPVKDLIVFIQDADTKFIFTDEKIPLTWPQDLILSKMIVVLDSVLKLPLPENPFISGCQEGDTASLLYTSGTTATPKGTELSHKNLLSNFLSLEAMNICSSADVFISVLPLFHAYAFMATLLYPFFIGAKIVYPRTLQSDELRRLMQERKVTVLVGVPELFYRIHKTILGKIKSLPFVLRLCLNILTRGGWLLKKTVGINILKIIYGSVHRGFGGHLKFLVSGGAALDPKVGEAFQKFGFDILEGYGLTETSPISTLNPPKKVKIGSVGRPVKGVEIKIHEPDSQGIGEILIRGHNVMKGYYRKPLETDEVIKEDWFYSGDLGSFDKDGYLFIRGRKKEVIVLKSGKNVFPDEVEKYYGRSKFIKEVGIFFSEKSQTLKAVVVPDFDAFERTGQVNVFEKIKFDIENISQELPSYKRILGFVLVRQDLPRTRLGKIKRYQLSDLYDMETDQNVQTHKVSISDEENAVLQTTVGRKVVAFLKGELSFEEEILAKHHFELDLGVDSLTRVELVAGLEKIFQVKLPEEALVKVATVSDLIHQIQEMLALGEIRGDKKDSLGASWKEILCANESEEQFKNINLHPHVLNRLLGLGLKGLFFVVLKLTCRLKVFGRENLPLEGPYIVCCNHTSYLDAFVVFSSLPRRLTAQTYFVGLKNIFHHPAVRWGNRLARLIPIDPTVELMKAMKASSFVLRNDKVLCIFPEGQRSIDGEVKAFKKGVGILSQELNVPVLPVAIWGTHAAWPRAVKYPKPHPVRIIFGKMIFPREILTNRSGKENQDPYDLIAHVLREEIVSLWKQIKE